MQHAAGSECELLQRTMMQVRVQVRTRNLQVLVELELQGTCTGHLLFVQLAFPCRHLVPPTAGEP